MRKNTKQILSSRNKGSFAPVAKTDTQPLKSAKRNADAIIMQVAKAYKDRSRKEIQSWRMALTAIEHIETPRYNRYFDLQDDFQAFSENRISVYLIIQLFLSLHHLLIESAHP